MKHTLEEKRNIVRQIKRGRPISSLCKALHLDRHMVRNWLLRYEKYGDQGLRIRTPKYHFNTQEKERIIWEHTKKRIPLQELSLRYDVDRSTIKSWLRKVRTGGSLYRIKQASPMARPKKKEPQTELEKLQAENLRLRAENALLKKVKALVEEKKARARENGQKPSTN